MKEASFLGIFTWKNKFQLIKSVSLMQNFFLFDVDPGLFLYPLVSGFAGGEFFFYFLETKGCREIPDVQTVQPIWHTCPCTDS
jgi:hypothetical protein